MSDDTGDAPGSDVPAPPTVDADGIAVELPQDLPPPPNPSLVAPAPEPDLAAAVRHEPRQLKRTWAQRAVLAVNACLVVACFGAAITVWYASEKANDSKVVTLSARPTTVAPAGTQAPVEGSTPANGTEPDFTIPQLEDLSAKNFLITGTDNNGCVDPDSPYAGAFEARPFTSNTDTVMMLRIDPTTSRAALLSFPRDLWVSISGSGRMGRINSAFNKDDPGPLMGTIFENFGIWTDHYVNIDFCAFKGIVDAVGGVKVPFEYATKDDNTGLNIPGPMCYEFDGDSGLAYVRSRHYEYLDPETGRWREDPASDLGRISRQQDFMQRLIQASIDEGATNPRTAKKIVDSALQYVIRDDALTVGKVLQFAQAMRNVEPGSIQTYQIEASPMVVGGAAVLDPRIEGDNMQAVLGVFQGRTQLALAPEQVFESTTTTQPVVVTTAPPATLPPTTVPGQPTTTGGSTTTTTSSLPASVAAENVKGITPPDDPSCR